MDRETSCKPSNSNKQHQPTFMEAVEAGRKQQQIRSHQAKLMKKQLALQKEMDAVAKELNAIDSYINYFSKIETKEDSVR